MHSNVPPQPQCVRTHNNSLVKTRIFFNEPKRVHNRGTYILYLEYGSCQALLCCVGLGCRSTSWKAGRSRFGVCCTKFDKYVQALDLGWLGWISSKLSLYTWNIMISMTKLETIFHPKLLTYHRGNAFFMKSLARLQSSSPTLSTYWCLIIARSCSSLKWKDVLHM